MSRGSSGWERLRALSPGKIDEIIGDLELLRTNARLFYAVDPHEIIDFCFPINPEQEHLGQPNVDIDTVADDQLALYEVFYASPEMPLLLPEYREELEGLHGYIEHFVDKVYKRADLLDKLIVYSSLKESDGADRLDGVVESVEEEFNLILAVGLGIYAIGIQRFLEIQKKLRKTLPGAKAGRFEPLDPQYQRSRRAWHFYEALQGHQRRQPWAQQESKLERARRERADLRDATALDRVLSLNAALEAAYTKPDVRVRRRLVVLYLSSAQKTRFFFSLPEVRKALPIINDKQFSIWRTREQIFAQAAFRGKGRTRSERHSNTIQRLKELRKVLDEIGALNRVFASGRSPERCAECVLSGGHGQACNFLSHCERADRLSSHLEERKGELHNLGLVSALERYRRVTALKPEKRTYEVYVNFIREVLGSQVVKDRVLDRMRLVHHVTMSKILFAREVSMTIALRAIHVARSGGDSVTGALQYLPLRPKLSEGYYSELAADLARAVIERGRKPENLVHVYDRFWEKDVARGTSRDHELLRCLLYACSATKDGTRFALEHARKMSEMDEIGPPTEFSYVLLWVGRRQRDYFPVDALAAALIAEDPSDQRFYHGRGLNTYSWLMDPKASRYCHRTLREACDDFTQALALYRENRPDDGEMVAALANNLAYMMVLRSRDEPGCLEAAREFIEQAKEVQHKNTWPELFPEYLHTEALLEHQEFLVGRSENQGAEWLRAKLSYARRDLNLAIESFPKKEYVELLETITRDLDSLG